MTALRLALFALCTFALSAAGEPNRRALLIGIDDYSASTLPRTTQRDEHRGWNDLKGAANDVRILKEMLVLLHGFAPADVVTLTNQQATRAAILRATEQSLVRPAAKDDVIVFYFAGHGAQVPNSASDELDRLDESIVPADSRRGAADIRDKELRPLFNRILDRGARLTLLLDHCHSGSSFRGFPNGARPRGIGPARPIVDGRNYGPRPEERGALALASTQDLDAAWETRDESGVWHGSFTWAWIRAMRDAAAGESAQDTFLRAQARLRAETPYQAPAMLGNAEARTRPFLATRGARGADRALIAVERVDRDGAIVLQGGWAHGLTVRTELRVADTAATRLRVTAILGLGRSIAHIASGRVSDICSGTLLEVAAWAAPQGRPLRVWMPRAAGDSSLIARKLAAATNARSIADPSSTTPTHVLRPRGTAWELLERPGAVTLLRNDADAVTAVARLSPRAALFVQLPIPAAIVDKLRFGDAIAAVDDPEDADYILAGRLQARRVEYAWIRPLAGGALPRRTAWVGDAASLLRDILTVRRIHTWHSLESPPHAHAPYRLAFRSESANRLVSDATLVGGEAYTIVLRAAHARPRNVTPRYYYAFAIDSHGKSYLAFPKNGSVENRFPIAQPGPIEIPLGAPSSFGVMPPYGTETYFLLSTEEPLPNPSILAWDGARAAGALAATAWSIERITLESVAAPRRRASAIRGAPRRR